MRFPATVAEKTHLTIISELNMKFKHILTTLTFGILASTFISAQAQIQMLDRIVAVVDDTTITQSEVDSRTNDVFNRIRAAGAPVPATSAVRDQVLDQLVTETLQLNIAAQYGVRATDEEVLQAIGSIMKEQGLNEEQLLRSLEADGVSPSEFRENLRRQLTLRSITEGLVGQRIRISEQEIDTFLQSADAKFWISPEYRLQHILIPVQGSSTSASEEAEKKANEIYQQLVDGANFTATAIAESKGPAALNGGDLGLRKSSELPSLFANVAPTLEINEIAKPFNSRAGFHIVKLVEKRGETKEIINQSMVSHILIKTNEIMNEQQALEKITDLRQQLIDGADFAELAKEHSDDIGSKRKGGSLGWSMPGVFVPAFEKAMNEATLGEITEPVKSQFGWHIILVSERRDEDFSEELVRQKARNFLVGRRFQDEVQLWLQGIRDSAYIELKI